MDFDEHTLFLGLAYCYEAYRAGDDPVACKELADGYVSTYLKKKGLNNDRN